MVSLNLVGAYRPEKISNNFCTNVPFCNDDMAEQAVNKFTIHTHIHKSHINAILLLQKAMMMRMMVYSINPTTTTTMYKAKRVDDVVKRVKCESSMALFVLKPANCVNANQEYYCTCARVLNAMT